MIDISNKFLVALGSKGLVVLNPPPPHNPLSHDDAVVLAAWLVALAIDSSEPFEDVLKRVLET